MRHYQILSVHWPRSSCRARGAGDRSPGFDRQMDQGPERGIFGGFETTMEVNTLHVLRKAILAAACTAGLAAAATPVLAQTTLRALMHSDLKIVDPIWTTAYIVRNHGYMIYDTLFAQDEKGEIKPQMVGSYDVSADKLSDTFKLRDGLAWHDGAPVKAEDCIASIRRWAAKDA